MRLPRVLTVDKNHGFSLAATIVLSLFVALVLCFFVGGVSRTEAQPFAALTAAAFLALFLVMTRTGRIAWWRRVFFVAIALFFFPSFIALLIESRGTMFITEQEIFSNQTPVCFVVIPSLVLPYLAKNVVIFPGRLFGHFASLYSILAIWLIGSLTVGRGWCSWVCFYGGWGDGCAGLLKKPLVRVRDPNGRIRFFGFALLIFVVLASLATLTAVFCNWLCPYKVITEIAEPATVYGFLAFIIAVLAFFGLSIVLPIITKKRVSCMTFCPFGAFQSLVDKISPYRIRIDAKSCTGCLRCVAVCPTLSLKEEDVKAGTGRTLLTCTKCGECLAACPTGAIGYAFAWTKCSARKGRLAGLADRIEGNGRAARGLRYALQSVSQIFSAQALLVTSGFCIGAIVGSGFAIDTLARLGHLATHGSFLFR